MTTQAIAEGAMMRLRRRGEYGFDDNMRGVLATISLTAASLAALTLEGFAGAAVTAPVAVFLLAMLGVYLHTTRRGKFLVWAEILDSLRLRGDEQVLDAGCGRGAVLTMIAERLPRGRAVGIDLGTADQSAGSPGAAERNLAAEGVCERCGLVTATRGQCRFLMHHST